MHLERYIYQEAGPIPGGGKSALSDKTARHLLKARRRQPPYLNPANSGTRVE
jgi:hypothetical protein